MRKLIPEKQDRLLFIGMVVIAANAGGAWSPIGDVTTTMLWIGGQVTTMNIIVSLFVPSLVCLIIPLLIVSFRLKGNVEKLGDDNIQHKPSVEAFQRNTIFFPD